MAIGGHGKGNAQTAAALSPSQVNWRCGADSGPEMPRFSGSGDRSHGRHCCRMTGECDSQAMTRCAVTSVSQAIPSIAAMRERSQSSTIMAQSARSLVFLAGAHVAEPAEGMQPDGKFTRRAGRARRAICRPSPASGPPGESGPAGFRRRRMDRQRADRSARRSADRALIAGETKTQFAARAMRREKRRQPSRTYR